MFSDVPADAVPHGTNTALPLVFEEAGRQLSVCNACRYCEGLCAVFPALERRTVLGDGDISQIANLCHDCRACFDACMYGEPHEFELNIPKALAAVRREDYRRYVWPRRVPRLLRGWLGVFSGVVVAAVLVVAVAVVSGGWSVLLVDGAGARSPYEVLPYAQTLAVILVPAVFAVAVMLGAARRYWRKVGGSPGGTAVGAVCRAVWFALTLRYLRGGGQECHYPQDERPSTVRRRLHAMVMYGFGLCFASTVAAGILQDILGTDPPYGWLSVPVLSGTVGGAGLLVGCTGLLVLKARSSRTTSLDEMTVKDYGFLTALGFLALSGLLTLLVRTTPAYGTIYLVHLSSVALSFVMAPYSKFVHFVYRFLAIVRDNLERQGKAA